MTDAPHPGADPRTMQLYAMAVEMADRVSARRGAANSFFVALQSGILAALGFLVGLGGDPWPSIAVCLAGAATSCTWFLLLRSYRALNRAKFAVITRLELELPHRVFADEWASLGAAVGPRRHTRYAELGTVERVIPVAFLVIDLLLAVRLGVG